MPRDKSVRYHNRVARRYDAIYDEPYWHFHDEVTWRHVKPHLPRDLSHRCLDLGCGTGKWGLKLLRSGFAVTFLDHAPAMIGKVQEHLSTLGSKANRADCVVADIVEMKQLPDAAFHLTLAMGDPISICTDAQRAANEMFRITAPGGVVIATADNFCAALEHYFAGDDFDGLEAFAKSSRTRWITDNEAEQFELTTFTPASLRKVFERAGFEVISVIGKTILPARAHRDKLADPATLRRLVELEMKLAKDESLAAAAGHLQIAARRKE